MDANGGPVVLINLFEVPAEADEGFIAAWEGARDVLQAQDGYRSTALTAALAGIPSSGSSTWPSGRHRRPSRPPPPSPTSREGTCRFAAHPGLYEILLEDWPLAEDPGGVVLINAFEVPPDGDDAFLAAWEGTRQFLHTQPGYLATRLHSSLSPEADFRSSPSPLACAVGLEVCRLLATGEFQDRAAALGARLLNRLGAASLPGVKEVRGQGLWAGIELAAGMPAARAICERLLTEGLFVKDTQRTTLRLAPTLVITEAELDLALERITKVLAAWDPGP